MPKPDRTSLFTKNTKCTCNYCGICGRVPKDDRDEPNRAPLRWWDGDDGWKIGSLCRWCWEEVCNDVPKSDDFAVATASPEKRQQILAGVPDLDDVDTDEDPTPALDGGE